MFSRRGLGEGWAGQCGVEGTGLPEAEFSLSSHLTQTASVKGVVSQPSPARAFQLRAVPQQRHLPVPQHGKPRAPLLTLSAQSAHPNTAASLTPVSGFFSVHLTPTSGASQSHHYLC